MIQAVLPLHSDFSRSALLFYLLRFDLCLVGYTTICSLSHKITKAEVCVWAESNASSHISTESLDVHTHIHNRTPTPSRHSSMYYHPLVFCLWIVNSTVIFSSREALCYKDFLERIPPPILHCCIMNTAAL